MSAFFSKFVHVLSRVLLSVTPQTAAHWAPLSMKFSRQEYWNDDSENSNQGSVTT